MGGRRIALGIALVAAAFTVGAIPASAGKGTTVHGQARTLDGIVIPGESETLVVSDMPKRLVFQLPVSPGLRVPRCEDPYACEPTLAHRSGGGDSFRTDDMGNATITFVMPKTFVRRNLKTGKQEKLRFHEGDGVRIQANGFKGKVTGIAVAKARVGG